MSPWPGLDFFWTIQGVFLSARCGQQGAPLAGLHHPLAAPWNRTTGTWASEFDGQGFEACQPGSLWYLLCRCSSATYSTQRYVWLCQRLCLGRWPRPVWCVTPCIKSGKFVLAVKENVFNRLNCLLASFNEIFSFLLMVIYFSFFQERHALGYAACSVPQFRQCSEASQFSQEWSFKIMDLWAT